MAEAKFYLPSVGGEISQTSGASQAAPILNSYSPRLFGAPPQLTHYNDMRLMSSLGDKPGPVGDFYLNDILRDAQVANFVVGRALFTGGMSTFGEFLRTAVNYAKAITKYNIYDATGQSIDKASASNITNSITEEQIKNAMENNNTIIGTDVEDENGDTYSRLKIEDESYGDNEALIENIGSLFGATASAITSPLLTSMLVQQPFYTFDADWNTYINNVKMMINTGVIMLGLQDACVRIGDNYLPIGMDAALSAENDTWANYRFITPTKGLGTANEINKLSGDTSQYVSFMIEPSGISENYNNTTGQSQIYSQVINQGASLGNEIAFITGASKSRVDDAVLSLAGKAADVAQSVLSNMTLGVGKFTAAIAGSMAKTFVGDHTIYPEVYQSSTANSSMSLKTKFVARDGSPYSFLIDCWVPMCFCLGMALPQLAKNNASAYSYPPLIQCSVPGAWGTRLGIIESLDITKNNDGKSLSVHGFPTSVEVSIKVKDLQHVMVSSGMDKPAQFLNNNTMFDYIAQSCGCDKYKVNGAIRLVSKLALNASASQNMLYNFGSGLQSDFASMVNTAFGTGRF